MTPDHIHNDKKLGGEVRNTLSAILLKRTSGNITMFGLVSNYSKAAPIITLGVHVDEKLGESWSDTPGFGLESTVQSYMNYLLTDFHIDNVTLLVRAVISGCGFDSSTSWHQDVAPVAHHHRSCELQDLLVEPIQIRQFVAVSSCVDRIANHGRQLFFNDPNHQIHWDVASSIHMVCSIVLSPTCSSTLPALQSLTNLKYSLIMCPY